MTYPNLAAALVSLGYTNFSCGETIESITFYLPTADENGSAIVDTAATKPSDADVAAADKKVATDATKLQLAQAAARVSALAKLSALGLTKDEITALVG